MGCSICDHPDRIAIDDALLARNWGDKTATFDSIARMYNVTTSALQVHSIRHFQIPEDPRSITDKVKFREADILRETANEYFVTLKNVGYKINQIVASNEPAVLAALSDTMVGLYLGAGKSVRETIQSLVTMDQAINGDQSSGLNALSGLVNAINGVKKPEET